ncbi:MAG: RAMP superfamily CRISPR-associated protein [Cyanobacteriota bacterium]|nr:RAMP superfamily CRISPR-associated protein [Cyanobacteriota bacterium]
MYARRYGLIRTLAPLHVGASEGEESGNLNLIFRDPYTQTGIVPGSSIRGRFRAECRAGEDSSLCETWYGNDFGAQKANDQGGKEAFIKEGAVKFEYASLLWLPVFCPGQPIVWVSCPRLLRRYAASARPELKPDELEALLPKPYTCSAQISAPGKGGSVKLFFNLGFLTLKRADEPSRWFPSEVMDDPTAKDHLVVVRDSDIGMIHDMALYRQSRVKMDDKEKKVAGSFFFNVEAIPEGSILFFPVAIKPEQAKEWQPLAFNNEKEIYLGGLESIGFGRCSVKVIDPSTTQLILEEVA